MEVLQAGVLSVLIALSGWIHDGLKSFEAEKYDDAITNLTKVIEKNAPENKYRDVALFYRAKSYHAKKDKKKALADILLLIQKYGNSNLVGESRKLYKAWGGDMKKLLPEESPKDIWNKFVAAAKAGDLKTALTLSTGDWETLVHKKSNDDPDKLKREFSQIPFEIGKEKIGTKDKAKTATLGLIVEGNNVITLEFVLDKKANKWLIAGYDEKHSNRRHGRSRVISNMNNLKQIGLACRMYSNVYNENFPAKLDDLKTEGFLENEAIYLWTDSKTGKKFPFIYAPGYNEADRVETMIAAAPKAVNGKREVLWLDGHVKTISENKFIKNAKKQKWKLPGLVKKEEVPEEIQKKVRELIAKLADSDFNVRKTAKEKLIKMGDSAYPFLEENKNNQDPEVKMTIKEILEK